MVWPCAHGCPCSFIACAPIPCASSTCQRLPTRASGAAGTQGGLARLRRARPPFPAPPLGGIRHGMRTLDCSMSTTTSPLTGPVPRPFGPLLALCTSFLAIAAYGLLTVQSPLPPPVHQPGQYLREIAPCERSPASGLETGPSLGHRAGPWLPHRFRTTYLPSTRASPSAPRLSRMTRRHASPRCQPGSSLRTRARPGHRYIPVRDAVHPFAYHPRPSPCEPPGRTLRRPSFALHAAASLHVTPNRYTYTPAFSLPPPISKT